MKETLEHLNDLVNAGTTENIELASMLCDSQGLVFEELESVEKYVSIIKQLSKYLDGYDGIKEGLVKTTDLTAVARLWNRETTIF